MFFILSVSVPRFKGKIAHFFKFSDTISFDIVGIFVVLDEYDGRNLELLKKNRH